MTYGEPARTVTRRIPGSPTTSRRIPRILGNGARVVIAAIAKVLGYRLVRIQARAAHGVADGAVPAGTTVFDDDIPGVIKLDPALLGALRQAAKDAAADGVEFVVNSGWRSREYQNQLRREAVSRYGSEEAATRWVATAETSAHVSGNAVDIGPVGAREWLSEHGSDYGLCQIYRNEPWHFELRPEAIEHGCPPMFADPTHDPRMRR